MLDVSIRVGVLNMMAGLRDREGVSLLYITHDLASARYVADRIVVMYAGHVAESGPTRDRPRPIRSIPIRSCSSRRWPTRARRRPSLRRHRRAAQGDRPWRGLPLPLRAAHTRSRSARRSHRAPTPIGVGAGRVSRRGRGGGAHLEAAPRSVVAGVELVIFDCDGVLIDSERLGVEVDMTVLRELGWPLSEAEVIERFVGRSDRDNRAAIEAHLGRKLPDGWARAVEDRYREVFAAELTPVDGVLEALDRITLPSCVASSGHPRAPALHARVDGPVRPVRRPDLQRRGRRQGQARPGSVPARRRADGQPTPAGCVVVEDSRPGVEAAAPRACACSPSPAGSLRPSSSTARTPSCSTTCASSRALLEQGPMRRAPDGGGDGRAAGPAGGS